MSVNRTKIFLYRKTKKKLNYFRVDFILIIRIISVN